MIYSGRLLHRAKRALLSRMVSRTTPYSAQIFAGTCIALFGMLAGIAPAAHAAAGNTNMKIIAYYGAGNLAKSEYARDTAILFNPTSKAITMTNWSIQTGGSTGVFSASSVYPIPTVTVPAGGFYSVAASGAAYISGVGCTSSHCNLNYPYDVVTTVLGKALDTKDNNWPSTVTTVALVSSQTALTGTCNLTASTLVDFLGVGASDGSSPPTCFSGKSYAMYTPSTNTGANTAGVVYAFATVRKNKCADTFDNANDWMLGYIDFANQSTAPQPCPTGTQLAVTSAVGAPSNPGVTETLKITATVLPATSPSSTGLNVTGDLSELGLASNVKMYDDGTNGDAVKGDGIYTLSATVASGAIGTVPGVIVTAADAQGSVARITVPITIVAGTFAVTTPTASKTTDAGSVVTFPITITATHGYSGILALTCTGSPNTNILGVPVKTQCVSTPSEVTVGVNGSATVSLAVATGTTFSASAVPTSRALGWIGLLSLGVLASTLRRRKSLGAALMVALAAFLVLNTTACATNAGLGNTNAAPGTYTYVLTATDSNIATVTSSLPLTVIVK